MSPPTTVNELLKAARSLFEGHGHTKRQYLSPDGSLCPSGALLAAQLNGDDPVESLRAFLSYPNRQEANRLSEHEATELRKEAYQAMGFESGINLVTQNDLENTAKEDVLKWFDRGIQQTSEKPQEEE